MRRFHSKVFDAIVTQAQCVTSSRYDAALGRFDNLVFQLIVDNADADGSLFLYLEHSSDGRTWETKNAGGAILVLSSIGAPTSTSGADPSGVPSLAFVRLKMSLFNATRVRARVYATARDGC